ncbi:MAG: elongation factor G [Candidatus Omnitrophota bacterium]
MGNPAKINFLLAGHAQSGKTTLAESLLSLCGATSRKGVVLEGTTVSDYSSDEIERKISINASMLFCNYQGTRVQMIDAPGYLDFYGEVISSARAVDNAVIVVDAVNGVEVGTEKVWDLLEESQIPRIIFINKMDKEGADLDKALSDIKSSLSKHAIIIKSLDDPELIEAVAENDDKLLEKYLAGEKLTEEEIRLGLHQAVEYAKVFPVISGSGLNNEGVKELLDTVIKYGATPAEHAKVILKDQRTPGEQKELSLSESAPLAAFVFKSIVDPYVGQLTCLRIFSGKLQSNTGFYNANKRTKERIGQIFMVQGKEQIGVESASCGDIVAIAKLKETKTSDSIFTDEKEHFFFEPIIFPEVAISSSVKPKTRQDEEKISTALSKLAMEDPTFTITRDAATHEMIISGLGDLHLDVMVARLKKRFNVEVEVGVPKVSYKETITKTAKVQGKFKRQSGGRGQYGDVWLEVSPIHKAENGKDMEFVDKIVGGAIPRNFIPSVEKGVTHACLEGVIAGFPLVNIRVTLVDGSYHDVDSSDMAFQIAGGMALKKAAMEAGPALLEPIMDVEIAIPEDYLGQISGDLNSRRGRIMGMDTKGKCQVVKAQVPQTEMFKYANDLRSITGGRGSYTMKFSHYEELPSKNASVIISKYQASKKPEEQ